MMMVKKIYNGLVTHDLHLSSGFYLDLFRGTYEIKKRSAAPSKFDKALEK
tara:strand:+ start:18 stop:167 length:150 start_codon:yes stop_codon:yes gene_type:complete